MAGNKKLLIFILLLALCSFCYGFFDRETLIITTTPNLIYGEMHGRDIGETIITAQNTYYNIIGLTCGSSNGVNCSNSTLTIETAGHYQINSQFAFNDGANVEFHLALGLNSTRLNHCHTERKLGTGVDVGSASFTCIDPFNVGDKLTVMIENVDNTNNPDIQSINLNILRVGD